MRIVISDSELRKLTASLIPGRHVMRRVANTLHQQVAQRFRSNGLSGGVHWPDKIDPLNGNRSSLGGTNGSLFGSFRTEADATSASIVCENPYGHVHQLGTVGKGGKLPTIVPKRKKMLYWPLTDRATPGWRPYLVQGRFTGNGGIVPRNADYVLIRKADIPPRPMLPDSRRELDQQIDAILDAIAD